jgi:C4-type Zn-finger protein
MADKLLTDCPVCDEQFEMEWSFDETTICPKCKSTLKLDWDYDYDDNVYGPWVVSHNKPNSQLE